MKTLALTLLAGLAATSAAAHPATVPHDHGWSAWPIVVLVLLTACAAAAAATRGAVRRAD